MSMKITRCSFGNITIDGKTYSKDVIIYPDHVYCPWWRKEGHVLHTEDLSDIIKAKLSTLIIGTGYYGALRVPDKIPGYLRAHNIEVILGKTPEAVDQYNNRADTKDCIAAFHLTC